jgi:hypothetical protein
MRCLSLAQAWQEAGGAVEFICTKLPTSLLERLKAEQCSVHVIDAVAGTERDIEVTGGSCSTGTTSDRCFNWPCVM